MFFSVWSRGQIELQFQHFRPPFDEPERKEDVYLKLLEIDGFNLPADYHNRKPSVDIAVFVNDENFRKFIAVF